VVVGESLGGVELECVLVALKHFLFDTAEFLHEFGCHRLEDGQHHLLELFYKE
jgi:hypothetical protein